MNPPPAIRISLRTLPKFAAVFLCLLLPAMGREGGAKGKPSLRFICVSSLVADHEVILASRASAEKWSEYGTVQLRSSAITDLMPAKAGELHLAERDDKNLKSICQFSYPAAANSVLVVLNANAEKDAYDAQVIDPKLAGFVKGSVLIVNLSTQPGLVQVGSDEKRVEAGQQMVVTPTSEDSGMYRVVASRLAEDDKPVLCYDRYISGSPDSRNIIFLAPDEKLGLKVSSLPIFD